MLEEIICAVTGAAESNNWLIGHIKAYIKTESWELWLSSVGAGIDKQPKLNSTGQPESTCAIGLTVIVFGPDEDTLHDAVQDLFEFHLSMA